MADDPIIRINCSENYVEYVRSSLCTSKKVWIALWLSLALNMVLAYACFAGGPYEAAIRRDLAKLPANERPYAVYLSTHAAAATAKDGEGRSTLAKVTAFMVASTSRAVVLERQIPVAVATGGGREGGKERGGELLRIDLRGLGWSLDDWRHVLVEKRAGDARRVFDVLEGRRRQEPAIRPG